MPFARAGASIGRSAVGFVLVKYPVSGFAIFTSVFLVLYATAPLRAVQPRNMSCDSLLFHVLSQTMLASCEQSRNIKRISVTFEVLKLERSSDVKAAHPKNIPNIVVTFSVLKLLRSSDVKAEQSANISLICVTFEVLK